MSEAHAGLFYRLWPNPLIRALDAEGIRSWSELTHLPLSTLLAHKGIGAEAVRFVEGELAARGLAFEPEPFRPPKVSSLGAPALSGVYFVRCGGFVKIGHAKNIKTRLKGIETLVPFPLALVHHVPCETTADACTIEQQFHDRFRRHRHRGEWFRLDEPVRAFLTSCGASL